MTKQPIILNKILIFTGLLVWVFACSSKKNTTLNNAFHNTTAHFNAYFIGVERIKEVRADIWKNLKPDYNHILPIFPSLDSTMATTYEAPLEDCIKKASMVIQYHKYSKWVDDSYNLIGLARMYGYDFPNAITTFKYVNTNGEDINVKHQAIINLMRTFIEAREYANAESASHFLEQERLNKDNLRRLYLNRAYYYQKIDDMDNLVRNLVLADPLLKSSQKSRYYFIIGQVYQKLNFESAAYQYYKKCVNSNPEYELSFYAKLNMAQVTQLSDRRSLKDVRKYFRKLVKDEKNQEFKDRIYYELALFELKQNNMDETFNNLKLSISSSYNNPLQKGMSYLKLGELQFDSLRDFRTAQSYYDSAVATLPSTYEFYKSVKQRNEVLDNFIKQVTTIELQDSLLNLSAMDSVTLLEMLTSIATKRLDLKTEEEEQKKRQETNSASFINNTAPTGVGNSTWYFDNPSAVASGRSSFTQVWGNRVLEDHWRRSVRQASDQSSTSERTRKEEEPESVVVEVDRDVIIATDAKHMFKSVPRTSEEKSSSMKLLEDALYNLGKIYYFDLEEKENADTVFNSLITRFPESAYLPEVYYQLYLYYNNNGSSLASEVNKIMHDEYSKSIYTKLIDNPNYQEESDEANEKLALIYQKAYNLFRQQEFDSARLLISSGVSSYPDYSFVSKLELLNILIIGKTESLADYQLALQNFITNNPDNELNSYAQTLLAASKSYRQNLVKLKDAEFSAIDIAPYFFVAATATPDSTSLNQSLENFIAANFNDDSLALDTLILDSTTMMHIVRSFNTKDEALLFFDLLKSEQMLSTSKSDNFVITKLNFDLLFTSKELDNYLRFFDENF